LNFVYTVVKLTPEWSQWKHTTWRTCKYTVFKWNFTHQTSYYEARFLRNIYERACEHKTS